MYNYIPDEVVIKTVRDYIASQDKLETVADRNGVKATLLRNWLKRLGIKVESRRRNWGAIKTLVQS